MNLEFGATRAATAESTPFGKSRWRLSRANLRARLHASLLALDIICIFFGFFAAGLIYPPGAEPQQWLFLAMVITPIYVGVALNERAYSTEMIQEPGRGVFRAGRAFLISAGIVILIVFSLKVSEHYSRLVLGLGMGIGVLLLGVARGWYLRKARDILGGNPYNVVLITDGSLPVGPEGFSMVIRANDMLDPADDSPTMFDRLAKVLRDVDRVVVACSPDRRSGWVHVLKGAGIQCEIIAPELLELAPLGINRWGSTPTMVVANGPLSSFDSVLKRAFDIVVGSISLALLAPLLIVTAIAIKLESRGPVFFIQTRIGQGNAMFKMLKFRSMRVDRTDGNGATSASRDDDRVTRIGRFIRRTSIDELPQLVNVLTGDMSIVGPRPHALGSRAEDKLFWEIDERYWHRHAAKPGLTGLAQVRGFRGATMRERDLTDRLQADLEYLANWTLWKDIKILMMTVGVVVHKNAF